MELNQERIEAAVVQEIADRLVDEDDLRRSVQTAVDQRIDRHFQEIADAQIKAAIDAAITNGFEREYQRLNSWGGADGPVTSIRAELEKLIGGYWNTKVDAQGKTSDSSYGTTTRAEWVMLKIVATDFHGAMKQHVTNLGGALKDALRKELNHTVNKLLSETFHVRSLDDQVAHDHYPHGDSVTKKGRPA